jgi:hypothetical protein
MAQLFGGKFSHAEQIPLPVGRTEYRQLHDQADASPEQHKEQMNEEARAKTKMRILLCRRMSWNEIVYSLEHGTCTQHLEGRPILSFLAMAKTPSFSSWHR